MNIPKLFLLTAIICFVISNISSAADIFSPTIINLNNDDSADLLDLL